MTNAEAAKYFASLPPNDPAEMRIKSRREIWEAWMRREAERRESLMAYQRLRARIMEESRGHRLEIARLKDDGCPN